MEVTTIIADLYRCPKIQQVLSKMEPEELRDDLKQEVFLILLEKDHQKIIELHRRRELTFYAIRILLTTIKSKTSKFYYQYRKHRHVQFV